ncbi:glycosyltransferase [Nitrospira sp. M1]
MKKILIFWPFNALGARTGAHQVQLADLMALLNLGYEITLFASDLFGDPDTGWHVDDVRKFEEACHIKIHLAQANSVEKLFLLNQQVYHPDTWDMYQTPWLLREFHNVFLEVKPDLVLIYYAWWGQLAVGDAYKSATRILRSVDLLEINGHLSKKVSPFLKEPVIPEDVDPSVIDEAFYDELWNHSYENESKEMKVYNAYDGVVTITESDARIIRTHSTCRAVRTVPTACALQHIKNSYDGLPLFVGSNNPLNLQGYVYFVRKVLPRVLGKIPGFRLRVVGGFSEKVERVQGVELSGYVPDLKPLYAASRFTVCPMLGGTGSQIKILESMAHGVPVIAMKAVASASPIEHGVNGFVANDAKEFAQYAIQLSMDSALCRKLGEAARQTIAEQLSMEQSVERWREALSAAQEKVTRRTEPQAISLKSQTPKKVNAMSSLRESALSRPKISVVTPTMNCAQYIRGCIESVLAQNYENFEHIIVDGASTDETVEILKEYPHLKWVSEADNGEAEALNKALAMADGDIISWLNADDNYFGHDVFRIVASEMNSHEGRHLVYGKTLLTDEPQAIAWLQIPRVPITLPILMRWFDLIELYQPSMFYSKELIHTIGKYREDLFFSIDYEFWLRIAAQGYSFHYVDHVLSQSRLFRESGKSALPRKEQEESWTQTATAFQHHLSEVERIHFWKDYYHYQLPYLKQSNEPITLPDDEWAQIGLALVLRGCGVGLEVVKLLEQTTTQSPQCSDAYWLLGDELLRGTKDYDRAKPILVQAQALTCRKQQEAVKMQASSSINSDCLIREVQPAMKANVEKEPVSRTSINEKHDPSRQERPLRVLFQNRPNAVSHPGGDTLVMNKLKNGLEQLGIQVDIALGQSTLTSYDLVHLFNFATPEYTEHCAREALQAGIPFVVTTLFEDWPRFLSKCSASIDVFRQYFENGFDEEQFALNLNQIRGLPSVPPSENSFVAQHASCLFASGEVERRRLLEIYPESKRVEVVKFGMDHLNADVGPELFFEKNQVKDYVLCVGRLETRKNQLMLLKALQDEQVPMVFVTGGVKYQAEYDDMCRRFPRKAPTIFVDRLSDDMLASCYRGAKVFCLPSWYELPGIVTIEAARFGCAVAATSWGTLKDYLPYGVHYCEPDDPNSIREAVLQAISVLPSAHLQTDALQYTWSRTVNQLVGLYHDILKKPKESSIQNVPTSHPTSYSPQPDPSEFETELKDAKDALAQGEIDKAKMYLEQLFQSHPTHSEGWLVSGVLSMQQQSYQEAVHAFSKALRFGGDDRKCRLGLAMAYQGQTADEKAKAVLLEVLRAYPDDEEAIHWLIRACTALDDWEELERSLSYYVQRNPANNSVRFALASVQMKLKKVQDAQAHMQTLQVLSPNLEGLDELKKVLGGFDIDHISASSQRKSALIAR